MRSLTTRAWLVVLALFIVSCAVARWHWGAAGTWLSWDAPLYLDSAWRMLQGQRPHADFSTPVGPVSFGVGAIGMALTSPTVAGYNAGVALFFVALTAASYALARGTSSVRFAALFAIFNGLCVVTPRLAGYGFTHLEYGGYYNRIGYAILAMLMIDAFATRPAPAARLGPLGRGAAAGVLVALLFFLKIPYFMVGAAVVVLGALQQPQALRYLTSAAAGAALTSLALLAYLRFDVAAVLRDLSIVGAARLAQGATGAGALATTAIATWPDLAAICVMQALVWPREPRRAVFALLRLGLVAGAGILLCASIMQPPELSIAAAFAFVLARERDALRTRTAKIVFPLLVLFVIARPFALNAAGMAVMVARPYVDGVRAWMGHAAPQKVVFAPAPLAGACCEKDIYTVPMLNEGVALAAGAAGPGDGIISVGFPNVLTFALQRASPKHDLLYWHYGVTFAPEFRGRFDIFDPERLFAGVTVIALHQNEKPDTARAFETMYGDYLAANFREYARGRYWVILKRAR